ncbi:hypothetical protein CTAYLR_005891 [Chrysophaeum taylorii]|uniref:Uncharacterized protein n=1 Tax=Chrysophaeum taylorii TaxID=2483200 RepID=A0AAD7UI31_9STRA|nr:hypothetical protein CTAYLR_005864 [Chrysophaeum taylorii]KAJ8614323.1 hypothetical protein CTAYLR_005891 [Chrysophaeum taylorii]
MDPAAAIEILAKHVKAKEANRTVENVELEGRTVREVAARVEHLQRVRVDVYADWDSVLERGLVAGEAYYANGCRRVTGDFDIVSRAINAAEAELRGRGLGVAGDCVRALQLAEERKLHLTAARHLAAFRQGEDQAIITPNDDDDDDESWRPSTRPSRTSAPKPPPP